MSQPTLDKILACSNLPSPPDVAMRVLELSRDPMTPLGTIAEVVQNDQALTARVLKTVNSSYYGLTQPCTSVQRACAYLGLHTIKSLVLGFSLVDMFNGPFRAEDLIAHWRRTIHSTAAARRLAEMSGAIDVEDTFTAALMQDIGVLAMHLAMPREYGALLARAKVPHRELPAVEVEHFGFTHMGVGAGIARKWNFPPPLIDTIEHHHTPDESEHRQLVRTVTLANELAETFMSEDASDALGRFNEHAACWFDISPSSTAQLCARVAEEARELAESFEVDTGEPPDINAILAQAQEAALENQLAVQREAERLRQHNQQLSQMARTDGLTGLGNRTCFDEDLAGSFDRAQQDGAPLAVILIDADHFKSLNDTHGHQAGDNALAELADRLDGVAGPRGRVYRYGGEEFVVVIPGADRRAATALAENIREAVAAEPIAIPSADDTAPPQSLRVTVSVGVAVLEPASREHFPCATLLLKAADRALYAAKSAGRNSVRVFVPRTPKMEQPAAGTSTARHHTSSADAA